MKTTLLLWSERRGIKSGRRWVAGLSVLLIAGLVAALCVVLTGHSGGASAAVRPTASASAGPSASKSGQPQNAAALRAEAALRGQAAAWIARQVSPAAVISCDPAMCSALQAAGVPSSQLLVLVLADADPLGSDVVIATSAVRSQFGSRLITVYAPEVIASFGTGAARIDVRAVAADGAAAFESALPAEIAARIAAGQQLLRNKRITATPGVRAALTAGDADPRLLVTLAALASQQRVNIVSFGDPSPGAPGVPLRSAEIGATSRAQQRAIVSFLRAQRAPYLPALIQTGPAKSTKGHFTITIEYDAPGPLGMGGQQ
ncbi:MAG TPA: hypothetical protein VGG16_05575 [Streptosporangiaceae bacterium]